MGKRNRRLSKASVPRYALARISINLGKAGHIVSSDIAKNSDVMKLVIDTSVNEAENWYNNYDLYHKVKQIVKDYMDEIQLPTRFQGLLMSYGEKIVANVIVDWKGIDITDLQAQYVRDMSTYQNGIATPTISYVTRDGKSKSYQIPDILSEVTKRILRTFKQ